jgi:iron complex outermembrane receptor protein
MPMEEISRIEVIRGSAGLAWGSNAVNGVVNIITKRAQDTAGWLLDSHAGTSTGKAGIALRYGAKKEDGSAFRVTLNEQRRDGGKELDGEDAQDQWNDSSLSFRYDKPDGIDTRWLVSGRVFDDQSGDPWLIPTFDSAATYNFAQYGTARLVPYVSKKNGGDLLGRLEESTAGGGEVRIQAYFEKFQGTVAGANDSHTTMDVDAQHRFPVGDAHDAVWGGNFRQTMHKERVGSTGFLTSSQSDITVTLSSVFAQDEWTIIPRRFNVQAGVRVEKQTFGGTAPQPSVRALWTPNEQHSLWLAWSKAVRSPSVVERTLGAYPGAMPSVPPMLIYAAPGEQSNFGNEKVRTVEAGHRAQWTPAFYSDLTAYMSKYEGVFGVLPNPPTVTNNLADPACAAALTNFGFVASPAAPVGLCMKLERGNAMPVRTRGVELSTEWTPLADWRLQINASRMWLDGGTIQNDAVIYGNSPQYQGSIRSSYNFTPDRQFDLWLRRIGGLANPGYFSGLPGPMPIHARTELDLRFAEQVNESLELSLTLQNLLSKQQLQFYPDYSPSMPVMPRRTVYLKALWHGK